MLTRQVERERKHMSKFRELAKAIAGDMKNFDEQADELFAKREELRLRGERVFAKHREHQAETASGLDAMEQAIKDLEGSNSKNAEGSDDSSGSFRDGN